MQGNIVQAQYFRDMDNVEGYLGANKFLTRLNAEILQEGGKNETGMMKRRLTTLENLVLVQFLQDITVVPKESAWFGSYAPPEKDLTSFIPTLARKYPLWPFPSRRLLNQRTIIPLRQQPFYEDDSFGIRTLDESGRIHFETCDATHMHLKVECWEPIVQKYVGTSVDVDVQERPLLVQGF